MKNDKLESFNSPIIDEHGHVNVHIARAIKPEKIAGHKVMWNIQQCKWEHVPFKRIGRPRTNVDPVSKSIVLGRLDWLLLIELGNGNASAGIRRLIADHRENSIEDL